MLADVLDLTGLKCPKPVLKLAIKAPTLKTGDLLEVLGDCPTFERDVRTWCQRMAKTLLYVRQEEGQRKRIGIQF